MPKMTTKSSWGLVTGVLGISALALGLGVHGAPRDNAGARDKGKVRSQASRLVSGAGTHLNAVVGEGGVATTGAGYALVTVDAMVGSYSGGVSYTAGGDEFTLAGGPERLWFDVEVFGWGAASGGFNLKSFVVTIDSAGFSSGKGDPVGPAVDEFCSQEGVPGDAECATSIGAGSRCVEGAINYGCTHAQCCAPGCMDMARADWVMPPGNPPVIEVSGSDYRFTTAPLGSAAAEDGTAKVCATLAIDVPLGAHGTYTIGFEPDPGSDMLTDEAGDGHIKVAVLTPGKVTIATGKCCYNIGGGTADCEDGVSQAACEALPGPRVFSPGQVCGLVELWGCACVTDADCSDPVVDPAGECTTDRCNPDGMCKYVPIAGWDQGHPVLRSVQR